MAKNFHFNGDLGGANEMRQIEEEGRATREQSERELLSMEQEYSGSLVDYSK